jgi:GNAT superfamily N-acetyltransferase
MSETWHLEEYDPPTTEQAIALGDFLRSEHRDGAYPEEKRRIFGWKLATNPYHKGFASATVTDASRRIVSLCTVTPKRYWALGREVAVGEIGDTFTHPDFQRKGLFSALVNASRGRAQQAGLSVVYGLPNDQSRPGYVNKLNFAIKEDVELVRYLVPLQVGLGASSRLHRLPAPVRAALASPLAARASQAVLGGVLSTGAALFARGFSFARVDAPGAEFDELWARARRHLCYAQVRDVGYLRWRYQQNPFPFEIWALREHGALVGFAVMLTIRLGDGGSLDHTLLLDWLYEQPRQDVARVLLHSAVREASRRGAALFSAMMPDHNALPLPFAPLALKVKHSLPIIIHQNDDGRRWLESRLPLHFTMSDTDSF